MRRGGGGICIMVREEGRNQATVIGTFGPSVTPTFLIYTALSTNRPCIMGLTPFGFKQMSVRRIQKEVQRLYGNAPVYGIDSVPLAEMSVFLEIIRYAHRIDVCKKPTITLSDITNFYNVYQTLLVEGENTESVQESPKEQHEDETSQETNGQNNEQKPPDSEEAAESSPNPDENKDASAKEPLPRSTIDDVIDEVCGAELSFQEEIPATALLEQPIPHVDESLGTSGTNNLADAAAPSRKTIADTVDFRPVALFHFRLGLSIETTTAEINTTFGENSVTEEIIKDWFETFRKKHTQVASAAITPQSQAQDRLMRALLDADPNKTILQLSQQFGASIETILAYLRMSGMRNGARRSAFSERQRRSRMEICSSLILRQKRDPNFLDRIITYGEVWTTNGYALEKKENVVIAVWWSSFGVVHYYILPAGGRMTSQLYLYHVAEMHKKLVKMKKDLVEQQGMIMVLDTQLPYISLGALRAMHQLGFETLPFPPNSTDLLPTDYHFVPHLRRFMADRVCATDVELEKCFDEFVSSQDVHFYVSGIYDLVARWKKCFSTSGDYVRT
ncbi:hypothetical protein Y032_0039g15 [Ancylostoma ceylanicum]|uniref:Mos1 transposase HTH domain-containing protein n=1 Tax=Ancylostoma ceylanicum TaxID=53326 RepID=A0A016UIV3_9BILA|nr:hypothetical protein Y032_0039g15 [Ancylostoma ceylanicum]